MEKNQKWQRSINKMINWNQVLETYNDKVKLKKEVELINYMVPPCPKFKYVFKVEYSTPQEMVKEVYGEVKSMGRLVAVVGISYPTTLIFMKAYYIPTKQKEHRKRTKRKSDIIFEIYSKEQIAKLRLEDIADKTGLSIAGVKLALDNAGVTYKKVHRLSDEDKEGIRRYLQCGESLESLSNIYGVSTQAIRYYREETE